MAEKRSSEFDGNSTVVPLRPDAASSVDMAGFSAMLAEHDRLLDLCHELEEIADSLPAPAPTALCQHVMTALSACHGQAAFQCDKVMTATLCGPWLALAQRITAMQAEQQGLGQEISLSLEQMVRAQKVDAPDMLGYMLRAWFEGCKRLIAIEELALVAFGRHHLSNNQLALLEARFAQN